MLTPGRRPRSRGMSSVSAPTFPPDLSDDTRFLALGDLPPRLPFQPHHPPLVRRVAAAAEAAAVSSPSPIISNSSHLPTSNSLTASTSPVIAHASSSAGNHPTSVVSSTTAHLTGLGSATNSTVTGASFTGTNRSVIPPSSSNHHASRRPRLLLRHRTRGLSPSSYLDSALVPSRATIWGDYAAHRMPVMFDERADWDTPYDASRFGGNSARRRLHTRRRRVSRLTDFLAWRVRRGVDGDDGENDSLGLTYEELLQLDDANVKCGLSNEELARLPRREASKDHMHEDCHICLDAVDFGAQIVTLDCKHVFHRCCIHTWLKLKRTCPICRYEL